MCQLMWTCQHVLIGADMCRYQSRHLWYQSFGSYVHSGMCQHICTRRHVLIRAELCWHVPTCSITLGTSDTNHLHLISLLTCVSTCEHANMCWYVPKCADMCQHVVSLSVPLILIIWTLFACWHVSTHVDMPTCVNMCRHVHMCANM